MGFTFRKEDRLYKKTKIRELFDKGSSFYAHPFKIHVLPQAGTTSRHEVLIAVSNRHFKRAVDRNLIKRRIREAYRLQRHKIPAPDFLMIGVVYGGKEILSFEEIQRKLSVALGKISRYIR